MVYYGSDFDFLMDLRDIIENHWSNNLFMSLARGKEIIRFSTKIGVSVVGGFKTLLAEIKRNNEDVYCYVNRRFSNGRLLTSLGFIIDEIIEPRYCYTNKSYDELFDADIIEEKCLGNEEYCFYCEKPQYKKIYDCGLIKFKLQ